MRDQCVVIEEDELHDMGCRPLAVTVHKAPRMPRAKGVKSKC
jgi:hypothetical protein